VWASTGTLFFTCVRLTLLSSKNPDPIRDITPNVESVVVIQIQETAHEPPPCHEPYGLTRKTVCVRIRVIIYCPSEKNLFFWSCFVVIVSEFTVVVNCLIWFQCSLLRGGNSMLGVIMSPRDFSSWWFSLWG
jgi:hypothetical protein